MLTWLLSIPARIRRATATFRVVEERTVAVGEFAGHPVTSTVYTLETPDGRAEAMWDIPESVADGRIKRAIWDWEIVHGRL